MERATQWKNNFSDTACEKKRERERRRERERDMGKEREGKKEREREIRTSAKFANSLFNNVG